MGQVDSLFVPPSQVDEYKLIRRVGRGGMGQVYLGYDTLLQRPVAVKFFLHAEPHPAMRQQIVVEGRALGRCHHPNIVDVYRVGDLNGLPYLVYEYVRGENLATIAKPLPWRTVLKIAIGIASGLVAAHHRNVLHRDITPANVVVDEHHQVTLIDFGLAELSEEKTYQSRHYAPSLRSSVGRSASSQRLPVAGRAAPLGTTSHGTKEVAPLCDSASHRTSLAIERVGTPLYMAPEIWANAPASEHSDIYSLGVVLYELCTGQVVHGGELALSELGRIVQQQEPTPLLALMPSCHPGLAAAIHRCLRKVPAERYSAAELHAVLQELHKSPAHPSPPSGNPYRGLRAFDIEHHSVFFGRDTEVTSLLELLATQPVVMVAGDSGIGKTSVCRAGVVPAVLAGILKENRTWSAASLLPGRKPLQALADALGPYLMSSHDETVGLLRDRPETLGSELRKKLGSHGGLLLLVDQLEELVTLSDPVDVRAFARVLHHLFAPPQGVRLLLSVRFDYLTRIGQLTGLTHALSRAMYLLPPLSEEGLREAIVGPARAAGYTFESERLVTELTQSGPAATSGPALVQFTLEKLWHARDESRKVIPAQALADAGGVVGALAHHADSVLQQLLPAQHAAAKRLLLRLVTSEGTRARCSAAALHPLSYEEQTALDVLVRGRLIAVRERHDLGSVYELTHDALLQGWRTLRDWLEHAADSHQAHQRLDRAAREWVRLGRITEALWGESMLVECTAAALDPAALSDTERAFLAASRRRQRRHRVARHAAILMLLAATLATYKLIERYDDWPRKHAAAIIEQSRQPNVEGKLGALKEAIQWLGSVAPNALWRESEAQLAMFAALSAGGAVLPALLHQHEVTALAFSRSGQELYTASAGGEVKVWNVHSGHLLRELRGPQGSIHALSVAPRGGLLAAAGAQGEIFVWGPEDALPLTRLRSEPRAIRALVFSPDGRQLLSVDQEGPALLWTVAAPLGAPQPLGRPGTKVLTASFAADGRSIVTGTQQETAELWDAATARLQHTLSRHGAAVVSAQLAPDGAYVLTVSLDHALRLWRATTGELVRTMNAPGSTTTDAVFFADGSRIVSFGRDLTARVWDVKTGAQLARLTGSPTALQHAVVSPDGMVVATTSLDHAVRFWEADTGRLLTTLQGHTAAIAVAAFSPDGLLLATAGQDKTARIMWGRPGQGSAVLRGHVGALWSIDQSADGQYVVTAGEDGIARIWSSQDNRLVAELRGHHDYIMSVKYSPDGSRLVTASRDGTARLWNANNGQLIDTLLGHTKGIFTAVFSPSGHLIATAGSDHSARLWDGATGRLLRTLEAHQAEVWSVSFSPDSRRLLTTGGEPALRIWDVATGQRLLVMQDPKGHTGAVNFATFSPDGRRIVSAGDDLTAQVWDAQTGQRLFSLKAHTDSVQRAVFSRSGSLIATAGLDGARLWDAATGRPLFNLTGHSDSVWSAEFSPDGRQLVTASSDQTVRLWDTQRGQLLGVLHGHVAPVMFAEFSPDGETVVTASQDGSARLFPVTPRALMEQGCERLLPWPQYQEVSKLCGPFVNPPR